MLLAQYPEQRRRRSARITCYKGPHPRDRYYPPDLPMASRRKKRTHSFKAPPAQESRGAEVATIGWMLTTMSTLVCEVGVVLARTAQSIWPTVRHAGALADLLLLAAVMCGTVVLILAGICFRIRRTAPPTPVTVFAVVVAIAPFVGLIFRLR